MILIILKPNKGFDNTVSLCPHFFNRIRISMGNNIVWSDVFHGKSYQLILHLYYKIITDPLHFSHNIASYWPFSNLSVLIQGLWLTGKDPEFICLTIALSVNSLIYKPHDHVDPPSPVQISIMIFTQLCEKCGKLMFAGIQKWKCL